MYSNTQRFHFCRWWRWRWYPYHSPYFSSCYVSSTGNRHPIPMDRVPTVSY